MFAEENQNAVRQNKERKGKARQIKEPSFGRNLSFLFVAQEGNLPHKEVLCLI